MNWSISIWWYSKTTYARDDIRRVPLFPRRINQLLLILLRLLLLLRVHPPPGQPGIQLCVQRKCEPQVVSCSPAFHCFRCRPLFSLTAWNIPSPTPPARSLAICSRLPLTTPEPYSRGPCENNTLTHSETTEQQNKKTTKYENNRRSTLNWLKGKENRVDRSTPQTRRGVAVPVAAKHSNRFYSLLLPVFTQ